MVYLALDVNGGREAVQAARASDASVWAGADVFTPHEQGELRASGLSLTVFSHSLRRATPEVLASALSTIEEHHPDETIWIQHAPCEHAS
jgi:hypothetical protein